MTKHTLGKSGMTALLLSILENSVPIELQKHF